MFVITKVEVCPMCRRRFSGSGSDRKKMIATQQAIDDAHKQIRQHWKQTNGEKCKFEHDVYVKNLNEYLRPKFGWKFIENIVAYING